MGETYDEPFLRDLAAALGGGYVRVTEAADVFVAADDMIERVSRPVLSDVRVSFDGFETRDCLPGHMSALPAGSSAVVVGRIEKGGKGSVTVTGSADEQEFTRTYDLSLSPDEEHNRFIPRLWAKAKIDDTESRLGLTGAEGDAGIAREVIDLSVTYQIMSRFTAFLVLESEEDYRTYGIERRTKMIDWTGDEEGIEFNQDGVDLNAPITGSGTAFYGGARGGLAMSRSAAPIVTTEGSGFSVSGPAAFHHFSIDGVIGGDEYFEGMGFPLSGPVGNEALGWYNARGQLDSISDIPLGGTGVVGNLRVGGGASGSFGFRSGGGRRRAALRGGGVRAGSKLKRLSYGYNNYSPQGPLFHRSGDVAGLTLDQPRRASWEYERLLLGKENEADPQRKTELRLNLALACEAAGRNARATRALKRVAEAKPGVPEIQMELAVLAGRSGDWPAMRSVFDAALKGATAAAKAGDNDNKLTQTRQQIGNYLSQLGRYAEAAEMFERLAADEDNAVRAASLYQQAANHRSSQQRLDLSRALWEKALERFPEGAPVLQQAAQWFLGQGQGQDPALALELLGKARELGAKVTPQLAGGALSARAT